MSTTTRTDPIDPALLDFIPRGAGVKRIWSERVFDAVPLPPAALAGVGLVLGAAAYAGGAWLLGHMEPLLQGEVRPWEMREPRIGLVLLLLTLAVPVCHHYAIRGSRRFLSRLRPGVRMSDAEFEAVLGALGTMGPVARRNSWLFAIAFGFAAPLVVDRDLTILFRSGFWNFGTAWNIAFTILLTLVGSSFVGFTRVDARRFAHLAERMKEIDLLDLAPLAPFGLQGLRVALLWAIVVALAAPLATNRGVEAVMAFGAVWVVVIAGASFVLPMRGIHGRIRQEKRAELARVQAAMAGERGELRGSPLAARADSLSLADLLAWERRIEAVREWPLDTPMLTRFALYAAIPLGSWLGSAVVERWLGVVLD